jgi:hypothetical protein
MLETGRLADRRDDGEDDQRLDLLLGQIRHAFRSTVMKRRGAASRSNVAPLRCRFSDASPISAEKFSDKFLCSYFGHNFIRINTYIKSNWHLRPYFYLY